MPRLLARCVHGLEWVCADEVDHLPGVAGIGLARREIAFDLPAVDGALLALRTADDVFLTVGAGSAGNPDEAAATLGRLDWARSVDDVRTLRPVPTTPVIDVVAAVEGHRFGRFAVENAVGPTVAARLSGHYLRRTAEGREPGEPDLTVRVLVRDGVVSAALRLAARPLHRRTWKRDTGPGTLHPPTAAALARLADPPRGAHVLDPFCGDGTIAVETALAFPTAQVAGHDLDPARLENAARNAARAGVAVAWSRVDAAVPGSPVHALVTNPPWNLAVDGAGSLRQGLHPFWHRLPDRLSPDGRFVAVTDATLDAPAALTEAGLGVGLRVRIRLTGRIADVVLAGPGRPVLPAPLHRWRDRALAGGVVTAEGF